MSVDLVPTLVWECKCGETHRVRGAIEPTSEVLMAVCEIYKSLDKHDGVILQRQHFEPAPNAPRIEFKKFIE